MISHRSGLLFLFLLIFINVIAQPGKEGVKAISSNNTIVNEYTALSADAVSGATSITVASNSLNQNARFSGILAAGDLIMIIQMQGATLTSSNDTSWGQVASYGNCGLYELASVEGVSSTNIINLSCGIK